MRIAALYDVHAMPWALEAVLAEVEADAIVVGGDFVGGPYPEETIELIRSLGGAVVLRGNAEEGHPWAGTLPLTAELDGVLYCHATPTNNTPVTTVFTPDEKVREQFADVTGTVVIGHTHHQFDRRVGDVRVVNAGSVGMAYEGEVAAFWALLTDGEPEFRKTAFDVERAVAALRASDWPGAEEFVRQNLLAVVTRDEAAAYLEANR